VRNLTLISRFGGNTLGGEAETATHCHPETDLLLKGGLMKKQSFFSFSLLFMLGISPAFMEAAELRSTLGTVEIQKAGSGVWTQGRPRTEVQDGDIVRRLS
jgi:hypothetical protein